MPSRLSVSQRFSIVAFAFIIASIISYILWRTIPGVLEENHIIESSQAILVFLAAGIHVHWSRSLRGDSSAPTAVCYHLTLSLLCLSVFVREVDVDQLGTHGMWPAVQFVLRLVIVLLWIALAIHLLRRRIELWANRDRLLFSWGSFLVYGGIFFYCCSWFFDKQVFPLAAEPSLFVEETLQLQGTVLFFLGALLFPLKDASSSVLRGVRQPGTGD